jgi:aminoglycoside phosphotransferase (APT) family kinase protein
MLAPNSEFSIEACLEPQAMRTLLQQALPGFADGRVTIERLRIVDARRNASRQRNPNPLTLRYELDVHHAATGTAGTRQFYGKVYRDGASAKAVHGTTALHLPQLDMLLWAWPADPGLPQLRQLLDPHQTRIWWGAPAHEISALRYVPERRATLRYARSAHGQESTHLFAKTFSDERGEAIHRRFAHFWDLAQHDTHAPRVAQPLGYCAGTRTFWQAQAIGTPLMSALASTPAASLPGRLARAIGTVHGAPPALAGLAPRDTAHWLTEIGRRRQKIARAAPELADRVARVGEAIERAAEHLPPNPLTLIHGDCHPDQVWVDDERIVLFDFDEFTLGDPMEDLAGFVTRLGPVATGSDIAAQLLDAYRRMAPERFCQRRLQWHLAIQHLLQASRAFVFQVNNWRLVLERRLSRVEALCAPTAVESRG